MQSIIQNIAMKKNVIKAIIKEKQQEISRLKLIRRPFSYEDNMCYVNVGIRRAGKSYLLYQDIQERVAAGQTTIEDCLFINFEDERLAEIKADELNIFIECYQELFGPKKPWVYLDEIQNIEGWEKFVRRLADSKYRVMVTGSNAKMLSGQIATTLGGRFVIREVLPFSWREYLSYHGIFPGQNWEFDPEMRLQVRRLFDDYFYFGGFSEAFDLVGKREWLNSLYQKILMGDIITRNNIRNERQLRLLTRKVADNVMQATAISRFGNIIKSTGENISTPTIKDYLQYMEESYLIFSFPNYASPVSEQETLRKRYFLDNGLLNLFMFEGETKLLENIIALHLRRKYWNPDEPMMFYYKHGNVDLDFYIPGNKMAVQASYSIEEDETCTREVNALVDFNKAFKLKKAIIVTYDEEETIEKDGLTIEVIPVWKWMLQ